jgi:hypothetical protein
MQTLCPLMRAHRGSQIGADPSVAAAARRRFPALLRELEARRAALGLSGFGLSVTTLEEVFLAVSAGAAAAGGAARDGAGAHSAATGPPRPLVTARCCGLSAVSLARPSGLRQPAPWPLTGLGWGGTQVKQASMRCVEHTCVWSTAHRVVMGPDRFLRLLGLLLLVTGVERCAASAHHERRTMICHAERAFCVQT